MDKIKITTTEPDIYDNVVEGAALFAGIFVGIMTRYLTSSIVPVNDTVLKRILRETGSVAISTAAMNMTTTSVKTIGQYLKPKLKIRRK